MSKIEWTDKTWNPITGCTKVSPGCKNCYAEGIARRFWGDREFTDIRCHEDRLPVHEGLKKPYKIFVCSMGDLFHREIPLSFIKTVFLTIKWNPKHTFIILTKRAGLMSRYFNPAINQNIFPDNIWLGVSVEDQNHDYRISQLLEIAVSKQMRFVSIEPMLSNIDLSRYIKHLDWVICGSESGPKRRPVNIEWIRNLRDQCIEADVPFFLKQMEIDGKLAKMPMLDGRIWGEMP